jgi:hypothetical protein
MGSVGKAQMTLTWRMEQAVARVGRTVREAVARMCSCDRMHGRFNPHAIEASRQLRRSTPCLMEEPVPPDNGFLARCTQRTMSPSPPGRIYSKYMFREAHNKTRWTSPIRYLPYRRHHGKQKNSRKCEGHIPSRSTILPAGVQRRHFAAGACVPNF